MATRKELTAAVTERYRSSDRVEKARTRDEFVAIAGFIGSTRRGRSATCQDAGASRLTAPRVSHPSHLKS